MSTEIMPDLNTVVGRVLSLAAAWSKHDKDDEMAADLRDLVAVAHAARDLIHVADLPQSDDPDARDEVVGELWEKLDAALSAVTEAR
jgi:hypothetical protein